MLKILWKSDLMVLVCRLAILYLMLALCRIIFYFYNRDIIGAVSGAEFFPLLKGALLFDTVSIVYSFALFVLLSLVPFRFRYRPSYSKILFWYFIVVGAVVVGLNLADAVYFHYTHIRLTADDLMFARNDNTFQLIGTFSLENWYMIILLAVMVLSMALLYRLAGRPASRIENDKFYYTIHTLVLAAAVVWCVAMARGGGLSRELRPITMSNAMAYTVSPAKGNLILSNPFCILRTASSSGVRYTNYFDEEELGQIYSPYHYPDYRDSTSPDLTGRNVAIVVLESFSAEHSAFLSPDLYPAGGGYTPFLDSLMRESYTLTRAYSNGRKSIEALPAVLASMPSFQKPFVLMPQGMGEGMQLPKILAGEGYRTKFFCASPPGSMGFDAYANMAGFDRIYDKSHYDAARPGNTDYDRFWGVWDEPFLEYMGEVLGQSPQPFFSTVFTISSHHPFNVPARYESVLPEGITKVHKPVAYTDNAVRRFFELYGHEEWFASTLFVFVADHVSSERFAPRSESVAGRHHIVTFFHTPDGALKGTGEEVFQQADIMPTILGLLRYDRPYFAFGRDIFNEPDRLPAAYGYFSNYFMIGDDMTIVFDEEKVTAAYSASDPVDEHNFAGSEDSVQQEMEQTLKAVIQQYYRHIEKRDYTVPQ